MNESAQTPDRTSEDRTWWKEAVVYQIYPKSFNDSDGDGVGDIQGIIDRVDHLDDLGIDVVWLSPVYASPHADNGYDISDYRAIDDRFGDMSDWERLRDELHARDIKVVMDLVVNHTSDEHEWFEKSRRREDGYEDYYYWRDPAEDGGPPNNWESFFGGQTWSWDEERQQYYLHLFDEKQPDLNWENPQVREDVYEMMNWWLEKGVDGFRMDVINLISKTRGLPDGEEGDWQTGVEHFMNGPRIHEFLQEMYDEVLAGRDVMTVGEMPGVDIEEAKQYTGADGDGLGMIFTFEHMNLDHDGGRWDLHEDYEAWDLRDLKEFVGRWQRGLAEEGWNSNYLGNHDQPRIVSRFGDDGQYRVESAKLLGTFLLTLSGTPYVYQGDEIGMTNVDWQHLGEVVDVDTINHVELLMAEHDIDDYQELRGFVNARSRDNARTPVQWDDSDSAGFTDGKPWLKVNDNYTEINVAADRTADDSVFEYYRDLVDLRNERDVFVYGEFEMFLPDHEHVFAFTQSLDDERVLVVLNFSDEPRTVDLGESDGRLLVSNYDDPATDLPTLTLAPFEATVFEV
ncbi:glycoside hydrolase family 13 protein [Haloarcula sp. GH36]|uniref:glycoside hydrolase family 13 protein n=1 Tax=Haloarcula montana TaxID=3111776 RepID=UPI002D790E88|nr:alpha-glucosidase [Haloarcula sp. GH36]